MRPLPILILVLTAALALVFAIVSLSSDPRRPETLGRPAADARAGDGRSSPATSLASPARVEAGPTAEETEPYRQVPDGVVRGWQNEILGLVVNPDREPVPEAEVKLVRYDDISELAELSRALDEGPALKPKRLAKTDEEGAFRFRDLDPAIQWAVTIAHPEYSPVEVGPINVRESGPVEELVELRQGFQLIGYVTDAATGAPIAGAQLLLDNPMTAFMPSRKKGRTRQETETDETGQYVLNNVSPGNRVLTCMAKGYATQLHSNLRFMGSDDLKIQQDCAMKPGMIIAGRVVAPGGAGIQGASIDAISHQPDNASTGGAVSKGNGEFLIEDIGEGLYTLRVHAKGWDIDPVPRIEAGNTNVLIQGERQGGVTGYVVDKRTGEPIRDFDIIVRAAHPTNDAYGIVAGKGRFKNRPEGTFEVEGISEGEFVAQADAHNYASSFSKRFQVKQGEITPDIKIPMTEGATLRGRVIDAYSGEPVSGATILTNENNWIDTDFTRFLGNTGNTAMTITKVKTDGDGYFEIKMMHPSEYQVTVKHPEYTSLIQNDIRLVDGEIEDIQTLVLSHGGTIRGTVYGPEGAPANGVEVFLNASDGRLYGGNLQGRTDAKGRFALKNVNSGVYRLSAARRQEDQEGGPFGMIVDMKNTEVEMIIADGQEYVQDLYLGRE